MGAPPTPLREALVLRPGGIAGPPSIERISEAAAPVTSADRVALHAGAQGGPAAVVQAAFGERGLHGALGGLPGDPDDQGAGAQGLGAQQGAVQDGRGARLMSTVSLRQAGSSSLPLTTTTGRTPRLIADSATARSFLWKGKPAPPRPLRATRSASRASCSPPIGSRAVHLEVHRQVQSFDKVEARRELGKPDHADFGDVGQGLVHSKPPEGVFHGARVSGAPKSYGAPGIGSVAGPPRYVSPG
ncbi:hypothetical protein SFUMM280S_02274 [Streptomyces fumanus]